VCVVDGFLVTLVIWFGLVNEPYVSINVGQLNVITHTVY